MTLEDLGYTAALEHYRKEHDLDAFEIGRVISEHKERYAIKNADREYEGEIIGNLRYSASSRSDFPAVGDWVAISEYDDNKVLIHAVLPRKTSIERQAVGKQGEKQIIATNIDHALILQSVNRDFNINRVERYLTLCNSAKVKPIIVLTKIDLIDTAQLKELVDSLQERVKNVPIVPLSNAFQNGIETLNAHLQKGTTYCLLGSSGVGKSTLINNLMGMEVMATKEISKRIDRGKHTTTHRELIVTKNGILIDNPGMREVGITDAPDGLDMTFEAIVELAEQCKFSDCTHTNEMDCAVLEALDNDEIDASSYHNYLRMEREKQHFELTVAEKRKKDKDFGKMVKEFKNRKNRNRY